MSNIGPDDGAFDCSANTVAKMPDANTKMYTKLIWTALTKANVDAFIAWEKKTYQGGETGYFYKHLLSYKDLVNGGAGKAAAAAATAKKIVDEHLKQGSKNEVNAGRDLQKAAIDKVTAKQLDLATFTGVANELKRMTYNNIVQSYQKQFDQFVKDGFKVK